MLPNGVSPFSPQHHNDRSTFKAQLLAPAAATAFQESSGTSRISQPVTSCALSEVPVAP